MTKQIEVVSFDADGTLWDFDATMRRALDRSIEFLSNHDGQFCELSADDLIADRDAVAQHASATTTMEDIRALAFRRTLSRFGPANTDLADSVTAHYLAERFSDAILFDDSLAVLRILGPNYRLALVSNGNSDPERCGLPGIFETTLFAQDLGVAKPDPRIYRALLDTVDCAPGHVVHVGDSIAHDVESARSAGLHAVWLNRAEATRPPDAPTQRPTQWPTIRSLAELPAALEAFEPSHL